MFKKIIYLYLLFQVSVLAQTLNLTKAEELWIKENPVWTVVMDKNYPPFEFTDKHGKFRGISPDYFKLIKKILDDKITIKIVPVTVWSDGVKILEEKKADIISFILPSENRKKKLLFTDSHFSFPMAIVTNNTVGYVDGLKDLEGKSVSMVDSCMGEYLSDSKPKDLFLFNTKNIDKGLDLVQSGKTYAYIDNIAEVNYHMANTSNGLSITGITNYKLNYAMAVRNNAPELQSILNKAMKNLDKAGIRHIYSKWLPQLLKHTTDYSLVWQIVSLSLLLLSLFGYWAYRLKRDINKGKLIEKRLRLNNEWLNCSLKSTNTAIYDCNLVSRTIVGNLVFTQILGLENEDVSLSIDEFMQDFVHPDDRSKLITHNEKCFENGEDFFEIIFRIISKNGKVNNVKYKSKVFRFDEYNNPLRIVGFMNVCDS